MTHATEPLLMRARRVLLAPLPFLPVKEKYQDVIAASDLPEGLQALVGRIARRTRLWRREKVDVARELCAHFRDGLDSGSREAELRESFGDEKASAMMIRRAKKRNRPWAWHVWKRSWQGVGALLALMIVTYGWLALRLYTAEPTIRVDYLAKLNAPALAVPEEERGWWHFKQALLLHDRESPVIPAKSLDEDEIDLLYLEPGSPHWADLLEYVSEQGEVLNLIHASTDADVFGALPDGLTQDDAVKMGDRYVDWLAQSTAGDVFLMQHLLPMFSDFRFFTRLLRADSLVAAESGDGARFVRDVRSMLGLGEASYEQSFLIGALVGISQLGLTMNAVEWALENRPEVLTNSELQLLSHLLASFMGGGDVPMPLESERLLFLDVLQHAFTDDGNGNGRLTLEGVRLLFGEETVAVAAPVAGAVIADRRALARRYDRDYKANSALFHTPLWKWPTESGRSRTIGFSIDRLRYLPIDFLYGATQKSGVNAQIATLHRDALLAVIALELFHRREGVYPQSLDELVPELLPNVPVDRFDGKPLRYHIRDDGTPMLYSVGRDLDDDAGVPPRGERGNSSARMWLGPPEKVKRFQRDNPDLVDDGDWVLWPPSARKIDEEREEDE